jgi:hypothetical protein
VIDEMVILSSKKSNGGTGSSDSDQDMPEESEDQEINLDDVLNDGFNKPTE